VKGTGEDICANEETNPLLFETVGGEPAIPQPSPVIVKVHFLAWRWTLFIFHSIS